LVFVFYFLGGVAVFMGLWEAIQDGDQFDAQSDYVIAGLILMLIGRLIWDFKRIRRFLARLGGRRPPDGDNR